MASRVHKMGLDKRFRSLADLAASASISQKSYVSKEATRDPKGFPTPW